MDGNDFHILDSDGRDSLFETFREILFPIQLVRVFVKKLLWRVEQLRSDPDPRTIWLRLQACPDLRGIMVPNSKDT